MICNSVALSSKNVNNFVLGKNKCDIACIVESVGSLCNQRVYFMGWCISKMYLYLTSKNERLIFIFVK